MRVLKSKITLLLISLLLCAFFIAVSLAVYASGDSEAYVNYNEEISEELKSSDIAEKYLSESESALSSGEREFLDKFGTLRFRYSNIITTDKVALSYDEANGILKIKAQEYAYTGEGRKLVWTPVSAMLGGKSVTLTDGEGSICIDKSAINDGCTVTYEASAEFSNQDILTVVNLYHDTAKYIAELETPVFSCSSAAS